MKGFYRNSIKILSFAFLQQRQCLFRFIESFSCGRTLHFSSSFSPQFVVWFGFFYYLFPFFSFLNFCSRTRFFQLAYVIYNLIFPTNSWSASGSTSDGLPVSDNLDCCFFLLCRYHLILLFHWHQTTTQTCILNFSSSCL